ncbi:MAG: S9 family peptidase [Ktedonobacteraceae bacterium]|nr:S9 family peptidase [Ktedonobacteraceae bacterium]
MTTTKYSFEHYLNMRKAYDPSFSPDGQQLSFLTDITGVAEVWSVPVDTRAPHPLWPEQLTFRGERITNAVCSPTARTLLVSGDIGGNEHTQLYELSTGDSTLSPLTEQARVIYSFGGWSPDGKRITYSSNERDVRYFDVYERDMHSGQVSRLLTHDSANYAYRYSPDGQHILVSRHVSNIRNQLLLLDTTTNDVRMLTPEDDGGSAWYECVRWSADRRGLYLLTNRERQFFSLAYLDLASNELSYLYETTWDVERLAVSHDGTRMALVTNEDGYSLLALFDVSEGWQARKPMMTPTLPNGVIYGLTWSQDGTKLAITFQAADDTLDIWVWDSENGIVWRATRSSLAGIPPASFATPSLIRYPTFDGREIPAFLYLPCGEQRALPVVIDVHGGPEGQARPLFSPVTQYLVACGYAVLVPNVRGSTGYGYEYQSLDDVYLRMDSVKDLQYATLWLCESGIADAQRIAVMGASYGGFMVLAALTTYPDLWAAGVDIVGISNFVTFLENTGPWRRTLREFEYGSLEHDREFLQHISPLHYADRITAPLFVVHGANDPRVPVGEAEQIVNALRERGVPVQYLRFEDEGHGIAKRTNRLTTYPAIARFLDKHLGRP